MSLSIAYKSRNVFNKEMRISHQSKHNLFKLYKLFNICNLHKTQVINIHKTQLIWFIEVAFLTDDLSLFPLFDLLHSGVCSIK